ncbi:MAG: hypothetical protein AAF441_17575 [Pseudomonadota bacterium]
MNLEFFGTCIFQENFFDRNTVILCVFTAVMLAVVKLLCVVRARNSVPENFDDGRGKFPRNGFFYAVTATRAGRSLVDAIEHPRMRRSYIGPSVLYVFVMFPFVAFFSVKIMLQIQDCDVSLLGD